MASSEERRDEPVKEMVHKTKVIQFLGRTTPIVLQNDNGPCPLLAICNVLLLKNNLNLSPDIPEVSQEKLLSLVAERLIDSNSNVNNKDAEYVENQQQNIADAIDLLPRLATGIDVNLKFRRIDDFEFTRECAIFDLLDIPLYHGWIVDPQDQDTECAIGSKSYNTLMGELVALETQNMEGENKKNSEDDCIDFAAATAAALGVPSPCLSRGISFDDSPRSVSNDRKERKGDLEEEVELFRVLKLSEVELPNSVEKSEPAVLVKTLEGHAGDGSETNHQQKPSMSADTISSSNFNIDVESQMSHQKETPLSSDCNSLNNYSNDLITFETIQREDACSSSKTDHGNQVDLAISENSVEHVICKDVVEKISVDVLDPHSQNLSTSKAETSGAVDNQNGCATTEISGLPAPNLDLYSGIRQQKDVPEAYRSSVDGSEPMYEGEERILDSGPTMYEDREPMYEGEVVLAKQEDESATDPCGLSSKGDITPEQGELIKNFLKNNASQLSINGLFCLRDGLKERELCVFFRNNHFNTMFKFDGELYLLATDQGYINQPDLVWEKLNEVNGDTVFMTGNFKEFKVDNHDNTTWDEQNAMASTADYLASIDNSERAESNFNSDLQLAIALQQQEFEQQPQPQPQPPPQRNPQQPIVSGSSRLVTGPQVSRYSGRNSTTSSRQEAKSKEKCIVM